VRLDAVRRRLLGRLKSEAFELSEGQSLVSLVDSHPDRAPQLLHRAVTALPVCAKLVGRVPGRLSVMLPREHAGALVESWHEAFVATEPRLKHSA
jgi:hypothetical protein